MLSYWENYKLENPTKAAEIQSLGLDFSTLPNKEVKEKIFALETTAKDSLCSIFELKQKFFSIYDGKIAESEYFYLMEIYDKKTFDEAKKYNIERTNTIWMIVEGWILEKVQEIERKYKLFPHRSKQDPKTLLAQFHLEDSFSSEEVNDFLILRKMHIYLKNYPMTEDNKKYVKLIEEIFDKHFDAYIKPFAENSENRKKTQLFNLCIHSLAGRASDEMKKEYEELITECNEHDISFYAELDIARERAIAKYSIM